MRDIDAASLPQRLGHRDDLLRRGHHVGRIIEPGGKAGATLRQRLGQPLAHVFGFAIGGGALRVAVHRLHPQGHVADQSIGVHRRRIARQTFGIFRETAEAEPRLIAQQVQRRDRPRCHPHRRQGNPAIADHDGGDSLGHLAQHAFGAAQHGAIVVGMSIDETGRHGLAGGNHLPIRRCAAQIADRDDPIARHPDIRLEARRPGTVEHRGIADDQVAAQCHRGVLIVCRCCLPDVVCRCGLSASCVG